MRRETMPPAERDQFILERIKLVMAYAWDRSPFYRTKWAEAGIHPEHIRTLEDFERVPVITKAELRQAQSEHPPFGNYLCVDPTEVKHVHGTSGTTGRPTAFGISEPDWRVIANAHARILWAMGIRPSDTVIIGSFFSLYLGSWGALIGAERLGASVFPFGAGVAGQTLRAANWMQQIKPTVFYGTPSYALHLVEVAADNGIDVRDFGTKLMFFSGEPGASVPSIRRRIETSYGARVFDSGSMAEMSPWMNLAESDDGPGMLCWQDIVYTEVVDPRSHSRVPFGSEGTPVYTHLERQCQPMIRLLSGDLTQWEAPRSEGRTYPVLPRGVYGRLDDMLIVRGANINPSAIDDVVMGLPHYGGEHRIMVTRDRAMDQLSVEIEGDAILYASGEAAREGFRQQAEENLRTALGVAARVVVKPPGALERTAFKARRVVDARDELQPRSQH